MSGGTLADAAALTIVVPAWNEEVNLPACLRQVHATFADTPYEVIIVDDGSRDGTRAIADQLADAAPDRVRVLAHPTNLGLGAALQTGFAAARGEYLTCCPADFAMTPKDWAPFAAVLGEADVIVGCRRQREGYNFLMRFNSWLYPWLAYFLFRLELRDVNWISVYRRDLIRQVHITQRGIPMLTEILVKLRDLGATFREVDCEMQPRKVGTPSAARFRIMWQTLIGLLRFGWHYRRGARGRTPVHDPAKPADKDLVSREGP